MSRSLDAIDCEIREVKGRTFKNLGDLLIEIVDRKLFQDRGFTNVEDYFQSEPHLPSARQAFRLIAATRFSRQLPDTVQQPKSERQVPSPKVRPLLGKRKEESRLLWTIATLVARERHCPLDGKFVANVVKEYENGCLREFVDRACELLGEKHTNLEDSVKTEKNVKRQGSRKRVESQETMAAESGQGLLQTANDVYYLTIVLCAAWGLPLELSNTTGPLWESQSGRRITSTKRQRLGAETRGEIQTTTTLLTQTLSRLLELCGAMGIGFMDSNCLTSEGLIVQQTMTPSEVSGVPMTSNTEPLQAQDSLQMKREPNAPSSEDEISVAEALINLSNATNTPIPPTQAI